MSTIIHYTFKFWLVLDFWNFWAGPRLWSMDATKIVAEGWSEGLKQLIIVLGNNSVTAFFEQNRVCVFQHSHVRYSSNIACHL